LMTNMFKHEKQGLPGDVKGPESTERYPEPSTFRSRVTSP
jgi:hypothetical protein